MSEPKKCALVGIAHILLITQYSPEHYDQLLSVFLHGGQYPALAFIDTISDGKIPD
jgi:hypothetical protein